MCGLQYSDENAPSEDAVSGQRYPEKTSVVPGL